ncbi:MAG: hypothetical protein ACRD26_21620 [Vicinamibacterales bacterium]
MIGEEVTQSGADERYTVTLGPFEDRQNPWRPRAKIIDAVTPRNQNDDRDGEGRQVLLA